MQFRLIPSAVLQGGKALQSDSGWRAPTGTYSPGTFSRHTRTATIHSEQGKKAGDLEGRRSHKSSDRSDGREQSGRASWRKGAIPGGFFYTSTGEGRRPDRRTGNKRRQKLDDGGWL